MKWTGPSDDAVQRTQASSKGESCFSAFRTTSESPDVAHGGRRSTPKDGESELQYLCMGMHLRGSLGRYGQRVVCL